MSIAETAAAASRATFEERLPLGLQFASRLREGEEGGGGASARALARSDSTRQPRCH